jgi:hypothetical protein
MNETGSWNELIQTAKKDTNLKSTLDIKSILNTNATPTIPSRLVGKNIQSISQETHTIISSIHYLSQEQQNELIIKLVNDSLYMFIDRCCDLKNSSYLRLIPRDPNKKQTGGFLIGVKILDIGMDILILSGKRVLQYKFDQYFIFQKLKEDELLFLYINNQDFSLS